MRSLVFFSSMVYNVVMILEHVVLMFAYVVLLSLDERKALMWAPNKEQKEAVNAMDGPVLVISCPGSGKTTTLLHRIEHIIRTGVDPHRILMVTFGKAAADDMARRCCDLFDVRDPGVTFCTIHALCLRILREETGMDCAALLDAAEINEWFLHALARIPSVADAGEASRSVQAELTAVRSRGIDPSAYEASSCDPKVFRSLAEGYEAWKGAYGRFDFDDILVRCRSLLTERPDVLSRWQNHWDYIQCDEYQDTNILQKDILLALADRTKNFCAVGDDDQGIYAFRGADSDIMMHFADDLPGARIIRMGTNYRSAQHIVDFADGCIRENRHRFPKDFLSARGQKGEKGRVSCQAFSSKSAEAHAWVSEIRRLHASRVPYREMAVLVRQNRQAAGIVAALAQAGIPYYTPDNVPSMYDDWCFNDIRSYLALSMGSDPEHETYYLNRVLNRPARYVSPKWFSGVHFTEEEMTGALDAMRREHRPEWQITAAQTSLLDWLFYFGPGKVTGETAPSVVFDRLEGKKSIHYDKRIEAAARFSNADPEEFMESFRALRDDAVAFPTVNEWLRHAAQIRRLTREARSRDSEEDAVRVMTMHKAKGLEWKAVFLTDVNASVLPGRARGWKEMEEERRVLYVGMTRARDLLMAGTTGKPSPFLEEAAAAYQEKLHPHISKKLAGSPVYHAAYGRGAVAFYGSDGIHVRFPDRGILTFPFPDAFLEHTLSYDAPPQRVG